MRLRQLNLTDAPLMLEWMHDGEHELTLDNYEAYIQALSDFYTTYPYESIFETE